MCIVLNVNTRSTLLSAGRKFVHHNLCVVCFGLKEALSSCISTYVYSALALRKHSALLLGHKTISTQIRIRCALLKEASGSSSLYWLNMQMVLNMSYVATFTNSAALYNTSVQHCRIMFVIKYTTSYILYINIF